MLCFWISTIDISFKNVVVKILIIECKTSFYFFSLLNIKTSLCFFSLLIKTSLCFFFLLNFVYLFFFQIDTIIDIDSIMRYFVMRTFEFVLCFNLNETFFCCDWLYKLNKNVEKCKIIKLVTRESHNHFKFINNERLCCFIWIKNRHWRRSIFRIKWVNMHEVDNNFINALYIILEIMKNRFDENNCFELWFVLKKIVMFNIFNNVF